MKSGHTQLAIILDRSGSMSNIRQSTIDAYNEFIGAQKALPGTANVMLVQFDSYNEVLYNENLNNVPSLGWNTFVPRGMTALHDAIGDTVDKLGKTLSSLPEDQRPEKVIVAVFTDGGENASKDYKNKVADIIKHQREVYNWEFIFFGANQDAVAVAATYNISQNNSYTFNSDPHSIHNTMAAASYMVGATRSGTKLNSKQVELSRSIVTGTACMDFDTVTSQLNNAA